MNRVIIIEDNLTYRDILIEGLSLTGQFEVIAYYSSIETLLENIQTFQSINLFLIDEHLPGLNGLKGLEQIRAAHPHSKYVLHTSNVNKETVKNAIELSIDGYITKSHDIFELEALLLKILAGHAYLDPEISNTIIKEFAKEKGQNKVTSLSPQELKVLQLFSEGLAKKEIGNNLNLSIHTIDGYTRSLFKKLNVNTATSAVAKGLRINIIK